MRDGAGETHHVMVLTEGNDGVVVAEALAQGQLGDRLNGQDQLVGTQRGVLGFRERLPLPHQLRHQLIKTRSRQGHNKVTTRSLTL